MANKLSQEEIIKALLDTSFDKSTGSSSLTDVADLLHVKKASLYNHFNSRNDLITRTTEYCREYIEEINFIPDNLGEVTKKYSAETVLKGIVNRYCKMHEKTPLFQIYTFIESQKYFDAEAALIVKEQKQKLIAQTQTVLNYLVDAGKLSLSSDKVSTTALWFCSGFNDILNQHLLERKQLVMKNPRSEEGGLFTLPPDEEALKTINEFVEKFVSLIN